MAWITPKTDWAVHYDADGNYIGDYLNKEDFNRIKNNLEYLKQLFLSAKTKYIAWNNQNDKSSYTELMYANEWNKLENNLQSLVDKYQLYTIDFGNKKEFSTNGYTIDFNELNRLESGILTIKEIFERELLYRPQIAFGLGKDTMGVFSYV